MSVAAIAVVPPSPRPPPIALVLRPNISPPTPSHRSATLSHFHQVLAPNLLPCPDATDPMAALLHTQTSVQFMKTLLATYRDA